MRVYRVFPNFLRQREQRVGGVLTVPQTLVVLVGLMGLATAARVNLWLTLPALGLLGLAVAAASPVEGELRVMRWLVPLRMWVARETLDHFCAFPSARHSDRRVVPLLIRRKGQIVLSTDVSAEPPRRGA